MRGCRWLCVLERGCFPGEVADVGEFGDLRSSADISHVSRLLGEKKKEKKRNVRKKNKQSKQTKNMHALGKKQLNKRQLAGAGLTKEKRKIRF